MAPLVRQKWPWSRRNLTDASLTLICNRQRRATRDFLPTLNLLEDRTLLTTTPTLTQLSGSLTSLTYGQADQLTATVTTSPAGSTIPSGGTVTFLNGAATIGTVALTSGTASLAVNLAAGSYQISAIYSGTSTFGSSTNTISTSVITTLNAQSVAGSNGDGGSSISAAIDQPRAIAVDSAGNLFIADTFHNRIREVLAASGIIITVAGNGTAGDTGDGGLATSAQIDQPSALAIDAAGDIFFSDSIHNVIREINHSTNDITTVAGNGTSGYGGDGSSATNATLSDPTGLALDQNGNLFIADTANNVIREINHSTGVITTVAGSGTPGYSGDSGRATSAQLYSPSGIAVDSFDDLYIADTDNNVIRYVSSNNHNIYTIAGTSTLGNSGDGGSPTAAQLANPYALVLDLSGDLLISDTANNAIREISSATGLISTIAGTGSYGNTGAGGQATSATLAEPSGIAVDSSDNLYIANTWSNVIDRVDATTSILTVVAGNGSRSGVGSAPGPGLSSPSGITVDSSGNIFIADTGDNVIREVLASSGIMIVVAGNGTAGYSGDGGFAASAELDSPMNVAVDSAGDLFIADTGNNVIREVFATTHFITTIVGTGYYGYYGDGSGGLNAYLSGPTGIAVDSAGDLFIADSGNNVIRELSATTGLMSTVAGNDSAGYSGDGAAATAAQLDYPLSVTLDTAGDLFITDAGNNAIREVSATTGFISTVAGNGTAGYTGDGSAATAAELNSPSSVAVDSSGNLFIADTFDNVIREVNATTGLISTVAGNGTAGSSGDGAAATAAQLSDPYGAAVDSSGNLYITDSDNDVLREVTTAQASAPLPITVAPASLALTASSLTKSYGAALPTLTYTITGFVNHDTSAVLTGSPILSTNAAAASHVSSNTYTITIAIGTLSASNYTITTIQTGTLTVTPAPLTITAPSATKVYGAAVPVFTLSPSSYSGFVNGDSASSLTTQPTISTLATPSSHVNNSPYAITASGAVDPDYAITYIPGTLAITAASLTITAPSATKVYGAAMPTLALTTSSYSGFVNGDSATSLTTRATVSTSANVSSHVNNSPYPVTASGAVDPDYTITYTPGTLAVTAAPLTITAPTATKTYGATMPNLGLTYTGFVNGDTANSLTAQPTVTTQATASSHVNGSPYAITVSGATDPDYTITYTQGILTVTPAPLMITAPSTTKLYGAALPSLLLTSSSYTGFVNGDTSSNLTNQATITTSATASSHVAGSPYTIIASGATDPDYTITYTQGTLTVTPAPLTITAPSATKIYGAALPSLTLSSSSYTGFFNGDTAASLTTQATVITTATQFSPVQAGGYPTSASGAADLDYTITYITGILTVTQASTTTTVTLASGSTNPSANGQSLTLVATIAPISPGQGTPTGSVEFYDGNPTTTGQLLSGSQSVTGGTATFTTSALSIATHSIYAVFSGSTNFSTSTSPALQQTVVSASTTVYLSLVGLASNVSTYGQTVNLQASVSTGSATVATGSVIFFDGSPTSGGSTLGTVTLDSSATAVFNVSSLHANLHSLYAEYQGNGSLGGSTSNPLAEIVTAAPLAITASSATKQYGAAMPSLNVTYSGFVNGDTSTSLTTQPTISTQATATSHVTNSPYTITATAATDPDYTITYTPGQLVITPAPLTITAPSATKQYGAAMPNLSVTYTGFVNGDTSTSLTTQPTISTQATATSHVTNSPYTITATAAVDPDYTITYTPGQLTITPAPLTVTAPSATKQYGAAMPNLSVAYTGFVNGDTSTSLTTQPTISTQATATSHVTNSPYTITAAAATDPDYTITYTPGQLTITPAPLTITAPSATKQYGAATPSLSVSYSGFVNGDSSTSLTTQPTISTQATATSHVTNSPYTITAIAAADPDYTITYTPGQLTITPAPLTITAPSATKQYGAAMPNLSVTYSGFVNGDSATSLTTQSTITTQATATSHVTNSPYTITAAAATDPDYTITFIPGQLTITPAPLTIAAPSATKQYGAAMPNLSVTYSGFVNGDSATSLTTQPTITTQATATSHVTNSPYTITAAAATDPDYTITFIPGQLTITPAPLTITAPSATKQYGSAIPTLSVTYSGFVNGDTSTSLSAQPTITTSATATSHVNNSPYAITATVAVDPDYTITYTAGQLTVTPVPLTITATNQTQIYNGQTFPANNLSVTYSPFVLNDTAAVLTGTLAFQGTALTAVTPGQYTITPSGLSDPDYTITRTAGTLTITSAPITVELTGSISKVYDGSATASLTPANFALVGVVANDHVALSTPSSMTFDNPSAGSNKRVTVSGFALTGTSSSNYTLTSTVVSATIGSITPAPLTITANNVAKLYGAAMPTLSASFAGFVGTDSPASLSTPATITTSATAASHVAGSPYAISISGAADPNYTITEIPGQLTITPAPLTITANALSIPAGQTIPSLTVTYSGFINGDSASSLTTPPTITTQATAASPAGTYPITVHGAKSPDYAITQLSANLTITATSTPPITTPSPTPTPTPTPTPPPVTAPSPTPTPPPITTPSPTPTPPTTVLSTAIQSMKITKHKSAKVIVLEWNSALNSGTALDIANFQLATVPKNNKQHPKPVAVSRIIYQPGSSSLTIVTTKPLNLNTPTKLTINALGLVDASGNPINSTTNGQPGSNIVILLTKSGAAIQQ